MRAALQSRAASAVARIVRPQPFGRLAPRSLEPPDAPGGSGRLGCGPGIGRRVAPSERAGPAGWSGLPFYGSREQ